MTTTINKRLSLLIIVRLISNPSILVGHHCPQLKPSKFGNSNRSFGTHDVFTRDLLSELATTWTNDQTCRLRLLSNHRCDPCTVSVRFDFCSFIYLFDLNYIMPCTSLMTISSIESSSRTCDSDNYARMGIFLD